MASSRSLSARIRQEVRTALRQHARTPWFAFWHAVEAVAYRGHEYSLAIPQGYRVYTPWFQAENASAASRALAAARASGPVIGKPDRPYLLYQMCRSFAVLDGDVAECGVARGGTAHVMAQAIRDAGGATLHLFDTFTGVPESVATQHNTNVPGQFYASLARVKERLSEFPDVHFYPGLIPETFSQVVEPARFSFVHVNLGPYQPTLDTVQWFWPRLLPGAAVLVSDAGMYAYRKGAYAAVSAFFAHTAEQPIVLSNGEILIIKR